MKSRSPLQRLLRARLFSFGTALVLHLGWALALCVLLIALRRGLAAGGAPRPGTLFVPMLMTFAALCAGGSAAVWGWRRQVVRWIRGLNDDDVAAALSAACTGAVSMTLILLVASAIPSLGRLLSRGEMDAVMLGALLIIGVLAVNLGWILFEGLGGTTPPMPGKLEASLSRRS